MKLELTLHQFGGISSDSSKLDSMTFDPFLVLSMTRDLALVTLSHQTFAQCDVRLNISSRTDSQTGEAKRFVGTESDEI